MSDSTASQPVDIVLVEDNPGDVVLVREALSAARVSNELHVLSDGQAALDYLQDQVDKGQRRPSLILLDLNLPKVNGIEVLRVIKQDPALRATPVVIMTSSHEETDIVKAYELQANCYITKPVDFDQLLEVICSIEHFWLSVVELPPKEAS